MGVQTSTIDPSHILTEGFPQFLQSNAELILKNRSHQSSSSEYILNLQKPKY